jgi:hypothetical protein
MILCTSLNNDWVHGADGIGSFFHYNMEWEGLFPVCPADAELMCAASGVCRKIIPNIRIMS